MADRIQLRRDTAANWTNYNPILLEGEPGIELDTDQWKMGDGIHNWNNLPYRGGECVQQTGQSTTVAMSQKAVTDELGLIKPKISNIENNRVESTGEEISIELDNGSIVATFNNNGANILNLKSNDKFVVTEDELKSVNAKIFQIPNTELIHPWADTYNVRYDITLQAGRKYYVKLIGGRSSNFFTGLGSDQVYLQKNVWVEFTAANTGKPESHYTSSDISEDMPVVEIADAMGIYAELIYVYSDINNINDSIQEIKDNQSKISTTIIEDKDDKIEIESNGGAKFAEIDLGHTDDDDDVIFENDSDEKIASIGNNGISARGFKFIDGSAAYMPPVYLSPNGNDNNDGLSENKPKLNIQNAINAGYRNLILAPGEYKNQQLVLNGVRGLSMICNTNATEHTIFDSHTRRSHAKIDNSIDVSDLVSYNSIYRTELSVDENHSYYKVFISKELPIIYDGSGYYGQTPSYYAILWEMTDDVLTCKKVVPVLTVAECENTPGTFTYDGSYLYVHPYGSSITGKTYKRLNLNAKEIGVDIRNCSDIYVEGIDICFFPYIDMYTTKISKTTFKNCVFSFTCYGATNEIDSSDIEYHACISSHAANDGWGITGNGNCSLFNCSGIHCYDDGVSHHASSTGVIDGGAWIYNGKGGVTPSYGSDVTVKNIFASHNRVGLYYLNATTSIVTKEQIASNCVLVDNIRNDLEVTHYKLTLSNSCYRTKQVANNEYTELAEYNNNQLN